MRGLGTAQGAAQRWFPLQSQVMVTNKPNEPMKTACYGSQPCEPTDWRVQYFALVLQECTITNHDTMPHT